MLVLLAEINERKIIKSWNFSQKKIKKEQGLRPIGKHIAHV